jgi:hypothetical protein
MNLNQTATLRIFFSRRLKILKIIKKNVTLIEVGKIILI